LFSDLGGSLRHQSLNFVERPDQHPKRLAVAAAPGRWNATTTAKGPSTVFRSKTAFCLRRHGREPLRLRARWHQWSRQARIHGWRLRGTSCHCNRPD
jgi:hypothetical protein